MAYEFTGFFARPLVTSPDSLPTGVVWRTIATPFVGVGIRLPEIDDQFSQLDELPSPSVLQYLASEFGLDAAACWVYLRYVCWGGDIDFVYGLVCCEGELFGPVTESERGKVEGAYTSLMAKFGIPTETALHFEPFVRGYWGECRTGRST